MTRYLSFYLYRMSVSIWIAMLLLCALPLLAGQVPASPLPTTSSALPQAPFPRYHRKEVEISMRDHVRLHTDIFAPEAIAEPLPIILVRTPYDSDQWAIGPNFQYLQAMAQEGYIFVIQDVRGRFKSEGTFVMMRPPRRAAAATEPKFIPIDEGTDAYDTIDWLVRNVPHNNGRVGMLGISYDGWLAAQAITVPHPALRAVSPQAPPADMFLGDDFHHNGAFRLSYGFEYAAMMETDKSQNFTFDFDRYDTYEWYLRLGPLANANANYLHGKLPTWNDFVAHPNYDSFWQQQAAAPVLQKPPMVSNSVPTSKPNSVSTSVRGAVPTLFVAGWWDQEDFYGPLKIYAALQQKENPTKENSKVNPKEDSREDPLKESNDRTNYLVVGPWNHGGWGHGTGRRLGRIDFGSDTAAYFRDHVQAPWFAHYLKDRPLEPQPGALVFESGSNRWVGYAQWPPTQHVQSLNLYFHANGLLSTDPPGSPPQEASLPSAPAGSPVRKTAAEKSEADSYLSDPAHPVPYRPRPIEATYFPQGSGWYTWLLEDQRFVSDRPDVLTWASAPLTNDVTLAGNIAAHLYAATSGSDSDWIVKLIDVYPEKSNSPAARSVDPIAADPKLAGYQLMVANEVLRGRFRNSFEKPEPVVPNRVTAYTVDLHSQAYRFLKGHRIMVQVQSSWFPLIDRNPQTFVPNIFEARAEDFRATTQRVFRTRRYPSHLTLAVTESASEAYVNKNN